MRNNDTGMASEVPDRRLPVQMQTQGDAAASAAGATFLQSRSTTWSTNPGWKRPGLEGRHQNSHKATAQCSVAISLP